MSFITTVPNLLKCSSCELGILGIITSRAVARIFHWGGSNCERSEQVSANNPRGAAPGGAKVRGCRWSPSPPENFGKLLGPLE